MIPEPAQRKLSALVQQAVDSRALAEIAKKQADQLGARIVLQRNGKHREADIERTMQQHEQALTLQRSRYEIWQAQEQLVARLNSWISEQRGAVLEPATAPAVEMNGTTLAGLRSRITKLATEHRDITVSGPTRDDARQQIHTLVERLGERGRPRIVSQLGAVRVDGWMGDEISQGVPTPHIVTLQTLCWLDPERVVGKLDEMLERMPCSPDTIPLDQRQQRLAEIEAQLAELELAEEHLVEQAAASGVSLARRDGVSPQAILGVKIVSATTARAA